MEKHYVYIMSSKARVLYVGMTNNLPRRMYEHKNKMNIGLQQSITLTSSFTLKKLKIE
ncbi:MAG: GIY-YIG nuclease family protein [Melioribacteraceae bacterium]